MYRHENKILHLTAVVTFYHVLLFAIQQYALLCFPLIRSYDGPWTTLKMTRSYRDLDMKLTWCIRLLWPSIIFSRRHVIHIDRHIDYLETYVSPDLRFIRQERQGGCNKLQQQYHNWPWLYNTCTSNIATKNRFQICTLGRF